MSIAPKFGAFLLKPAQLDRELQSTDKAPVEAAAGAGVTKQWRRSILQPIAPALRSAMPKRCWRRYSASGTVAILIICRILTIRLTYQTL